MNDTKPIETRLLSSLVKVFSNRELDAKSWDKGSMLKNEVYSFQCAYRLKLNGDLSAGDHRTLNMNLRVKSPLSSYIGIRKVVELPSDLPCYADHDDYVLSAEPGLYPDLLMPFDDMLKAAEYWQSIWVTVDLSGEGLKAHKSGSQLVEDEMDWPVKGLIEPGTYDIELIFTDIHGNVLDSRTFYLTIIDMELPKQKLYFTEWFHTDCIATWYGDEVFSEAHWHRIGQYMKTAACHGVNTILTPLFTPPLDTQVGGERPTVQLVDVYKSGDRYTFGFDRLKRWISLCRDNGIEYLEFSHLFTQWGARHAPKIMAQENGELKRIFGWETDAAGVEYESFLDQFLPELVAFIKENSLEKKCFFHVSDEPSEEHLESYGNASRILNKHLTGFPIMDALSSFEFYKRGLVKRPIPASDHIEPFLKHQVPDLWTYYCCGQYKKVSNRFFNMPSARNRIIGIQLYKYNIAGFLQWGYNFWYSQYSINRIDPFKVTDAGGAFPSGDAFLVYPGQDGPLESIRLEVFYEALQDLRALSLLEALIGRRAVIELLDEGLDDPITFSQYPRDDIWLLNKRESINRLIAKHC